MASDAPELPELGAEERRVLNRIERRLREERLEQSGPTRPLWSVLQTMVGLSSAQIEQCIDAYHNSVSPGTGAPAPSAAAAQEPRAVASEEEEEPAEEEPPESTAAASSKGPRWQRQAVWRPVGEAKKTGGDGNGGEGGGGNSESTHGRAGDASRGKDGKSSYWNSEASHGRAGDGSGGKDGKGSYWNSEASYGRAEDAERLLRELRRALEAAEDKSMLLSKLGAGLSPSARSYLEATGMKLARFLAEYTNEFQVEKIGEGQVSVTYTAGTASESKSYASGSKRDRKGEGSKWQPKGEVRAKLYVGNLPYDVQREEVESLFGRYGHLADVKVMQGRSKRTMQSCAFVVYPSWKEAEACLRGAEGPRGLKLRPGEGNIIVKYASDGGEYNWWDSANTSGFQ